MKMVFFPKKLHRASSLRRWYLILQFLLDKRSIFDADSTQMQMQLQMMQLNLIRDFLLFFNQWWWEDLKQRRWWQQERSNKVAQFIAVILTASFLKQDNNQDVLRWWDGGGLGGPVEHGGGRLGLTLVSWQQEGGPLYCVLWCLNDIIISTWEKWNCRKWELYKCVVVVCVMCVEGERVYVCVR